MNNNYRPPPIDLDVYTPEQMYKKVQEYSTAKLITPAYKQIMLGVIAGGYIGLGCLFYLFLTATEPALVGWDLFLGGVVFSVGYIMALLTGGEVFTSSNLQAMSWASGRISTSRILNRWILILFANALGAMGLVVMVYFSGILWEGQGEVATHALSHAHYHTELARDEIFFRAVLGNLIICIAIWVSFAGRTVIDKLIPMLLIIPAVPLLNLEHIAASLFYIPLGLMLQIFYPEVIEAASMLTFWSTVKYLTWVTLGNVLGGSGLVALVYYVIYRG